MSVKPATLLFVRGLADGQASRRRVSAVEVGQYITGDLRIAQSWVGNVFVCSQYEML